MRRAQLNELINRMEPDALALIPGASEVLRSNDSHYRYRQDSDFYYLTGFDEPESIAVIAPSRPGGDYILFVRDRDPEKETWEGRRSGVEGAVRDFGAAEAFPISEFPQKLGDIMKDRRLLYYRIGVNPDLDQILLKQIRTMRAGARKGIYPPEAILDPGKILHEMRLIKGEDEIALMQRAADIASEAHVEAIKAVRPGMKEYEVEAIIEYVFRRNGATAPAYTTISGGGPNATVLHYIKNNETLRAGDLLLIDAGPEYQGYAADITRTIPISGKYTAAQRDIYSLVLEAQLAAIEMARPGVTIDELHNRSVEILTEGMLRLGLLQGEKDKIIEEGVYKRFYMHRLGHFLGMDVHDVGRYHREKESRALEPGMIITIEPGLYISPDDKDAPESYRSIGVRIEDDILITPEGNRVLTARVPKQMEEIEALMAGAAHA